MTDQYPQEDDFQEGPDQIQKILDQAAQRTEAAFQGYLRIYARSNPRPQYQVFAAWGVVAIVALALTAASATGLAFAASFNTELAAFFNNLSKDVVTLIAFIIAGAAVLGIEGYMVTVGMMKGVQSNGESPEKKRELEHIYRDRGIAAIILLVVSSVAGLFQRSFLVNDPMIQQAIKIVLMLVAGIGIPVSIWLAAPSLGLILNFQNSVDQAWLNKAREEFNKTNSAALAQRELDLKLKAIDRQARRDARNENNAPPPQPVPQARPRFSSSDVITWYLQTYDTSLANPQLEAKAMVEAFAAAHNLPMDNGDLVRAAGAVRTQLSRERDKAGIRIT